MSLRLSSPASLLAAAIFLSFGACTTSANLADGAGGGTSSSSATAASVATGAGGGAGGDQTGGVCAALKGDVAQPVTLRVHNTTSASIFLAAAGVIDGPTGVRVDDQVVLSDCNFFTCDDVLANQCQALDCLGGPSIEVLPDATFERTWSGHLLAANFTDFPSSCGDASCTSHSCKRGLAAADGAHVLAVQYRLAVDGPELLTLDVPFTLPTSAVTATIAP